MNLHFHKIAIIFISSLIIGAEYDNSFAVKWTDLPWGPEGYTQTDHLGAWSGLMTLIMMGMVIL